jgi:hypothetical protein
MDPDMFDGECMDFESGKNGTVKWESCHANHLVGPQEHRLELDLCLETDWQYIIGKRPHTCIPPIHFMDKSVVRLA